jgi:hypothetical protein
VLNESIKKTFDDQQKAVLHEIREHFKKHRTDSVEAIDRKIQESVDRQLAELKAQSKMGRDDLNAEIEKGKAELMLQSKMEKDELQMQLEQGIHVLNTHTNKGKDELSTQITMANIALDAHTKTIDQKLNVVEESIVLYTRTVDNVKRKGIEELQETTETGKQELDVHGQKVLKKIKRSADFNTSTNDDKVLKGM